MSQYVSKPFRHFGGNINVKVDLSNYTTKTDLKNVAHIDVVVKNDVVKKTVYDKLIPKVNNIDTSDFVLKTKYIADKTELEKKIPDIIDLVKKLIELEKKSPDVSSLARKTALTDVENKIPSVSSLVKKKQIITQKLLNLKSTLLTIIMTNILLLQSLILWLQIFLMRE